MNETAPPLARLEFFVAQAPKQKGNSKRIVHIGGKPRLLPSKKDKQAENSLVARVLEFRPPAPLLGALRLDVTFVLPIPSMAAWRHACAVAGLVYPTKRPDRGNLLKLIEDALEGPFYVDDSQIVCGDVAKAYGEIPGYRITLQQLPEPADKAAAALAAVARGARIDARMGASRPTAGLDPALTKECPVCEASIGTWCLTIVPNDAYRPLRAILHDERCAAAEYPS